jgi:putative oxidoreductase
MKHFTQSMHVPVALAMAAIITEFAGSICLALGLLTRVWAIGMGILIAVAAYKVHWVHGWWMNWYGGQKGEGIEFHVLVLGMSIALAFLGGGNLSVDQLLGRGKGGGGSKESKPAKVKFKK